MHRSTLLFLLPFLFLETITPCFGQDSLRMELAALDAELDAIFANEADSISLMSLLDDLINMDSDYSEMQLRLGYSSRVTSAGRDFGIDQQGLSPGISYYHKSGLYADVSGFWNSELDPKYNLSVLTTGYLGRIKRKTTYSFTYDHSFFSQKDTLQTLTNSLSAAVTHYFKYVYTGLDYSFSFGTETANRLIWNITGNFKMKGFGPFKRVSILPSIAVLFGNQNITNQYLNPTNLERFENLSSDGLRRLARRRDLTLAETRILFETQNRLMNGTLTDEQQSNLESYFTVEESYETFTLLNYYLTLPIVFYTKNLNLYFSYNYNIPRNISDDVTYEPNGYFGFAVTYNFRL